MKVKAEGTSSPSRKMTFKPRKYLPDLCSFLITAKHYLALPASSFTTSLLLLFAVTSFMSVVSWQNSKSNRENFGVILWVLKRIFFLLFPTAPSKEILMYHYFIPNNILHLYGTFQLTKCFYRCSFKVHVAEGGQWEDLSPWTWPRRGDVYPATKGVFCAMPFPARQQGGLTGDYVSLPGSTETKQRVRQDHPPLPPPPLSYLFPQLVPFAPAFDTLKIPKFHCCVQKFWPLFLNFIFL